METPEGGGGLRAATSHDPRSMRKDAETLPLYQTGVPHEKRKEKKTKTNTHTHTT